MSKRKLTVGEQAKDTRDVPLITEYVSSGGKTDEYYVVESCTETKYGMMVVTAEFKGTLWLKSQDYKDLKAAIEECLASSNEKTLLLFAKATRKKTIEIAVDDELPYGRWERIDDVTVVQNDFRAHQPTQPKKFSMIVAAGTAPEVRHDDMQGAVPAVLDDDGNSNSHKKITRAAAR